MLISDQARDWPPCVPSKRFVYIRDLKKKSTVSGKFTCDDLSGEIESY